MEDQRSLGRELSAAIQLAGVSIVSAAGANRIQYMGRDRITEAFDKGAAPNPRSIGIIVQVDPEDSDEPQAIGIGLIGAVVGIASATVRATISPLFELSTPVTLSELSSVTGASSAPTRFYALTLSAPQSIQVMNSIFQRDPESKDWLERQLASLRTYSSGIEQARVEARDAVGLAASIAGVTLPSDALSPEPIAQTDEDLLDSIINRSYQFDLEEELLPMDLLRFDGKLKHETPAASMAIFRDPSKDIRLAVFCVNKKPLELELGVDLIYWDRTHDTFTFVQYKRLENVPSSGPYSEEWVYRRRSEIQDQLKLMPSSRRPTKASADWRMTDTPFWFKFVRGDAGRRPDNKVLKGMYVAADWLRLAMAEPLFNNGPHGGFRVTYDSAKYVGRGTFVQLVSRGLIGTTSTQSASFKPVINGLGKDRQLIVAVKDRWNQDEDTHTESDLDPLLPF